MEALCPFLLILCSLQALVLDHVEVKKIVGILVGKNIKELGLLVAF